MDARLRRLFSGLSQDVDGIWCGRVVAAGQEEELKLRQEVARQATGDVLASIAGHHSVEVMDAEVRRALRRFLPPGGIVVDVGGCWGWHWRHLAAERPDASVVIVDFVKENLLHARRMLGPAIGGHVHLVHGDATCLPFPDDAFDLYWSVQVLQHVPDFEGALREARRVLKEGAWFLNYSLNRAAIAEAVYRLAGRDYVVAGRTRLFWLARATAEQRAVVAGVFGGTVAQRFSEILFQPNFGLRCGTEGNLLGRLDARLSSSLGPLAWIARQRSFEARKRMAHDV